MISKEKIEEVVKRIVAHHHPEKIFLFGSYARGDAHEDSDIDLLIIDQTLEPGHKRAIKYLDAVQGVREPVDILVYTPDEFKTQKNQHFTFPNEVFREGKLIYERSN